MPSQKTDFHKKIKVAYEDTHTLVVFKQAGDLVVPAKNQPPSLEEFLQETRDKNIRAVHRIDKVTEGLVLFAKTDFGEQALLNAFKKRLIDKRYLVIAEGVPTFRKKTVSIPLKKETITQKQHKYFIQKVQDGGQRASTFFRILSQCDKASLIEARPFTGRMHQIRAHLSHLGFPINGDELYQAQHLYPKGHIGLCACGLNFPPPKGKRIAVIENPSPTFQKVCRKLGLDWTKAIQNLAQDLNA